MARYINWGSPGEYFVIDCSLGYAFGALSCQFRSSECCFAVWCSAANTHLELLHRVVSDACSFYCWCVWVPSVPLILHIVNMWQYYVCCIRSCVIRYTLSMVLNLCRMFQCWCYTQCFGFTDAHRYTYKPPRCRTWAVPQDCYYHLVSLLDNLADSVFDGVGLAGFKSKANIFLLAWASGSLFVFYCFPFFLSVGLCCGPGVFRLIGCQSLSPGLQCKPF